jgi:hypothetical protein
MAETKILLDSVDLDLIRRLQDALADENLGYDGFEFVKSGGNFDRVTIYGFRKGGVS